MAQAKLPLLARKEGKRGVTLAAALGWLVVGAALDAGSALAQSASWNETLAKAKQEGTVVLYTAGLGPTLQIIQQEFTKATGIRTEGQMVNAGPQRERVGRSVQAKQVQVDVLINNDTPFIDELLKKGELQDLSALPNKASFPKQWWQGAYPFVGSFSQVVMVNTKFIDPKSIRTWQDLLNPKFRERVVVISPASGLGSMTFYANLIDSQGPDYIRKLGELKPAIVSTSVEGSQLVASGEKWIYPNNVAYNTVALKAKGAPVEDVYLPPTSVVPYVAVALQNGRHPAAGRVLVNWLLSKEGQEAICGQQRLTCSLPGVPGSLPLAEKHVVYNPADVAKRQDEIVKLFEQSFRK